MEIPENFYVSFSRTDSELRIYHLFVCSNVKFLLNFLWLTFQIKSVVVLYCLYANKLHSLMIWVVVSSLSLHYLHLLFCWIISIFPLIIWPIRQFSRCSQKRFSFSNKVFLSQLCPSHLVWGSLSLWRFFILVLFWVMFWGNRCVFSQSVSSSSTSDSFLLLLMWQYPRWPVPLS